MNPAVVEEAWYGVGAPTAGGVLIVGDHASGFVPPDIDLGIDPALLTQHIALDIGVAEVARLLVEAGPADTAFLAGVSRLVIDLNRDTAAAGLIPASSDGQIIPGNRLSEAQRAERIARFYHSYHAKLAEVVAGARPAMIVSLHSFTPGLVSDPTQLRPWDIGILYNQDDRLARVAIPHFAALGLTVGDQQPYSGIMLNHTMNVHAEAYGVPYLGIEMRQDRVRDAAGQRNFADMIGQIIALCRNHLAQMADSGQ